MFSHRTVVRMSNTERPLPGDDFVQSLARGLDVITSFDAEHGSMTLSEVSTRTGLNRATARRLLLTLVELGYVRLDGRSFTLTPHVLRLGSAYLAGMGLPEIAQPHLERLTASTGESSSLAVLDGTEIVYVARVATTHRLMRVGITVGTRFPAFATSMGRVLLAALRPTESEAVLARTPLVALTTRTVVDPHRLRTLLDTVHRVGHAEVDQELEIGLRSLAVPVTHRGRVVAAVNLSMSASRSISSTHLPALHATAAAITGDLVLTGP